MVGFERPDNQPGRTPVTRHHLPTGQMVHPQRGRAKISHCNDGDDRTSTQKAGIEGTACKEKLAVFSTTAAQARSDPTMAAIQAAIAALNDFGKAVKAALAPTRDLNGAMSCKQKGEPNYGTDFAAYIKIRRWTRRVVRFQELAFPRTAKVRGSRHTTSSLVYEPPRMPGDEHSASGCH